MSETFKTALPNLPIPALPPLAEQAASYWVDAWQRSILFWDTLRERGNVYVEHSQSGKPPVLVFDFETVLDARTFDRPANYALVRIEAQKDHPTVAGKRPFVVIDPRAGHGPGIGGFKMDSEIGVAPGPACRDAHAPDDGVDGIDTGRHADGTRSKQHRDGAVHHFA